ncbi:hypothetical protein J3A65_001935 [Rhizobium sp. PvP014]|nr:hypothetical protein [Rhizobium sp. PvP014]MBP2528567.1 hypothetical protein [Rhizobium sp. PvP099]
MHDSEWQRSEVGARVDDLFDAARVDGPQTVIDANGTYEVTFTPQGQSLEDLFSKPGIISGGVDDKP